MGIGCRILMAVVISWLFFFGGREAAAINDSGRFDISYIWVSNLDNLLEYREEAARVLGPEVRAGLQVVGRNGLYGLIYDRDGDADSTKRLVRKHSELLVRAGLEAAAVIKDSGYTELYNVSYGLGSDLDVLKGHYTTIYRTLGKEAGKNLFIEKTAAGKYALIYRSRSERQSTVAVAKRHADLLAAKDIKTSITRENSNEVVFGESSLLDSEEGSAEPARSIPEPEPETKPVPLPTLKPAPRKAQAAAGSRANDMEEELERFIKDLRRQGVIGNDERTGWLVYDFTSRTSLVEINTDRPFQAASMVKPFVALAFFHQVKAGRLAYGPEARRQLEAMIQRSNNNATNWAMRQVGGPTAVQRLLKRYYGDIFSKTAIVEYIPAGGQTYRNRAPLSDYSLFLEALWQGRLPYAVEIRRLMALPGQDRLYHGTTVPEGTLVYNKTGTTAHLCGDMGILAPRGRGGQRYPYAIIGVIEKAGRARDYGRWKMARGNVIRQVSSLVFKVMQQRYDLH